MIVLYVNELDYEEAFAFTLILYSIHFNNCMFANNIGVHRNKGPCVNRYVKNYRKCIFILLLPDIELQQDLYVLLAIFKSHRQNIDSFVVQNLGNIFGEKGVRIHSSTKS